MFKSVRQFIKRILFAILAMISFQHALASNLDVHGRPMTYPSSSWKSIFNSLGHIGIEYSGGIYNMIDEASPTPTLLGNKNFLRVSTISSFSRHAEYWGARYDTLNSPAKAKALIDLSMKAGVDYTWTTAFAKDPSAVYNSRTRTTTFKRGVHRCDTFVHNVLFAGGQKWTYISTPSYTFNSLPYKRK